VIFGGKDSQNVCRKVELFLIWCVLSSTHVDIRAFIICRLLEVSMITREKLIGVGGTITTTAQALSNNGKFSTLEPQFLGGSLDIAALSHMSTPDTKDGTIKYPYHKQVLFSFFAVT